MSVTRQNKVGRLIQKELSSVFHLEARSHFPGTMITITVVRISTDLSVAKIYLSIFPSEKGIETMALINEHKKHLRFELGNRIRNQVRIIPELAFFIDDSLDYAQHIEDLLKK